MRLGVTSVVTHGVVVRFNWRIGLPPGEIVFVGSVSGEA